MIIDKKSERPLTVFCLAVAFCLAHLCFLLLPSVFTVWQEQTTDRLLRLKSRARPPHYDGNVVSVDLNNASMQAMNDYYLDRGHHAQVVRNLAEMGVAVQMYDYIFAGPTDAGPDSRLIRNVGRAGNVYMGMAFRLAEGPDSKNRGADAHAFVQRTQWEIPPSKYLNEYYIGRDPLLTFADLARQCRGLGFLSLKPDRDGVFRRIPLLVRYGDGVYPSFSLRVVTDLLGVPPRRVIVRREAIVLKRAMLPGRRQAADVVIPVDRKGCMRIHFVGPWGAMHHYHFSDVYFAADDPDELTLWQEELAGKIVLVANVSTGSADMGQIPVDTDYPLSGLHANAVHTILTRSFLHELSGPRTVLIELMLLAALMLISFHRSAVVFTFGAFALGAGYALAAGITLFYADTILPVVRPLLMIAIGLLAVQITSAVANARTHAETENARKLAEKELDIGRRIQAGFLPDALPAPRSWQIAAYFKPARQVAGDFYDVFELGDRRFIGLVVADVCDKGVGAALFMAIIRTMIRASSIRCFEEMSESAVDIDDMTAACLLKTVSHTNNYIATTHERASMFATLFAGVLDTAAGKLSYVNCGHEPPVMLRNGDIIRRLTPTGPALGMMPDLDYRVHTLRIETGDILFAFTDGVTDAQVDGGPVFGKDRLVEIITSPISNTEALLESVVAAVNRHVAGSAQFDDLTMVAMRREEMTGDDPI